MKLQFGKKRAFNVLEREKPYCKAKKTNQRKKS